MLKLPLTYDDFNGDTVTEEYYFNMSKVEILRLEAETGGFTEQVKKFREETNGKEIFEFFERMIAGSYGIKSEDGKRFMKSDEIRKEFMESPAYDALLTKLLEGGADFLATFMRGIMPKDIVNNPEFEKAIAEVKTETEAKPTANTV